MFLAKRLAGVPGDGETELQRRFDASVAFFLRNPSVPCSPCVPFSVTIADDVYVFVAKWLLCT